MHLHPEGGLSDPVFQLKCYSMPNRHLLELMVYQNSEEYLLVRE